MTFFKRRKKKQQADDSTESQQPESASGEAVEAEAEPEAVESVAVGASPVPMRAPAAQSNEPEAVDSEPRKLDAEADEAVLADNDQPKPGLWGRLSQRLKSTRDKIGGSIDRLTLGKKIDEEVLDELEEVLVTGDLGVTTSLQLIEDLRGKVRRKELGDGAALKEVLKQGICRVLAGVAEAPGRDHHPHVIMVVGVNGVGKTTTIGKLAKRFQDQGRSVLLAAGDTFRAAAGKQLAVWAERVGCDLVGGQHGADPSSVAFDALEAGLRRGRDMVIIDTAGRLHTKVNLMDELKKVHRVLGKKLEGAPHEVLLVLDATTGQNALQQAKLFNEAVPLSGLVLTKLDGTAKGGVVVAIAGELKLPICFVGLGEGIDDLKPFDAKEFSEAIF